MPTDSPLDKLNESIVDLLQIDGRMPYAEIAAKLDVSEGTIRNRVNGMKSSGALRIVAIADPVHVKYETDAMLAQMHMQYAMLAQTLVHSAEK